ncbi:unnamed protein product [Adineta steineri]|uniref:Pyridoxal-dependent decarboxylase domain-containing protein 1 n=1 Tax=Adineta steineri TaxID=433720 RepID=A0A814LPL9_9BILA|nr:unnamed protein product [Adineta steineri]CAF1415863.1 unnamed protein product [Adineta steineri]
MEQTINDSILRSKSSNMNDLSTTTNNINHDDGGDDDDEIDHDSAHLVELNNRIKSDFMSYCLSFVQEDEEARECVHIVWNKYLQCVGDVSMISAFFDTLPFNMKSLVFPKYQNEINEWYQDLFHINSNTILYSTFYSETFSRIIRYAIKQSHKENDFLNKKAIIYVSVDFNNHLKTDLLSSIPNIKFQTVQNNVLFEDMIDINQLNEIIKHDLNDTQSYPCMVIANAGTAVLGRCDEITKIKQVCNQNNLWLHVIGDLVGTLALLSTVKDTVNINCDSLTVDTVKLFGIQNLPYLTFFIRPILDITQNKQIENNSIQDEQLNNDNSSTVSTDSTNRTLSSSSSSSTTANHNNSSISHPFYDHILHSPSISFLSLWSISQRCSKANVLYHMKHSFNLVNSLMQRFKQIGTLRILNDDNNQGNLTFKRICSGDAPDDLLPKTIVIFRFETIDVPEIEHLNNLDDYIDLLNLWLYDKLSQQYPKMNLQLIKSVHFQMLKSNNNNENNPTNLAPAHAIRFAPLEHLQDAIDEQEMQAFTDDVQRYSDILLATMTARARLSSSVAKYENLITIPMSHWAGIGAVRYIPTRENSIEKSDMSSNEINTIQAELARKLQTNDSAFSLGGGTNEHDSMFYLRLGMIRKRDDLDVLLQKIADGGKETETALKYVEDMAEKIKIGIDKVQKDLQNENQQILAQEGLLRQLPVISNIMSWWSPSPTTSPLATKGRSFDLNSGRVESTEDTYAYRMQVQKQSPHAPTHNDDDDDDQKIITSTNSDTILNSTDSKLEQKDNQ